MTNVEIQMTKECRSLNDELVDLGSVRHLGFVIRISFVI